MTSEPQEGEWIEWKGGACPIVADTLTDVRFRNGNQRFGFPAVSNGQINWRHNGGHVDIIAYRIVKP